MDRTDRQGRRAALKKTAFWLPEFQPEARDKGVGKVGRSRWDCFVYIFFLGGGGVRMGWRPIPR